MLHGPKSTPNLARQLRRKMTLPEVLLWQQLRKRPEGFKFRKQRPAGPYVLDFFCAEAKLGVEVDGEMHNRGRQPDRDLIRDKWLESQGAHIMRIGARDVLRGLDAVVRQIVDVARGDYPSTACGGPPPPPGEE